MIEISLKLFKKLYPIGKGGFGRVWKIQPRNKSIVNSSNMYYALRNLLTVLLMKEGILNY